MTATTSPAGLAVDLTYSGSATAPSTPGNYDIVATINDPTYAGGATGSLVISHRTMENWLETRFTPAQILAGESAADADPDRDGLTNLAEYALGGLPYVFTPQPQAVKDGTTLSIVFQRPAWASDISYGSEVSPDFANWSEATLEVLTPGTDPETVRASWTITGTSPRFMRLRFAR